jgi:hypothetical protein
LKNLTVPVIAIGKLLSPWLLRRRAPTARQLGRTFHPGDGFGPNRPQSLRSPLEGRQNVKASPIAIKLT